MGVRLHRDVSQLDVAVAVKTTATSVSEWEADKKSPREPSLERLATFLGVTAAYLRYGVREGAVEEAMDPALDERLTDEEVQRHAQAAAARAKRPRRTG